MTIMRATTVIVLCPNCGREKILSVSTYKQTKSHITQCRSCASKAKIYKSIFERFWEKVNIPNNLTDCWHWAGSFDRGYGHFNIAHNKNAKAHKFLFELFYDDVIPEGYEIDHLCRNRDCVNPLHLEIVTHKENMRRGLFIGTGLYNKIKTHCPKGHPYDETNTYINPYGKRNCKICLREATHRFQERHKA